MRNLLKYFIKKTPAQLIETKEIEVLRENNNLTEGMRKQYKQMNDSETAYNILKENLKPLLELK